MTRQDDMLRTAKEVQLGNYAPAPFVLTHGRGRRVTDAAGREYLDLSAGISVLSVGHSHPTLSSAIGEQAARLMHVSNIFYNDRAIELADALCARTAFDKVYFCNSGSEANEAMLKLARRYHHERGDAKRVRFVSTVNSFHGRTMGSLSLTGQPKYHEGMKPLIEGVRFIEYNDVRALEAAVEGRHLKMGIAPGSQGDRGEMIFRGDRREMVVVDHETGSYHVMDQATMNRIAGQVAGVVSQMQEALKNVPEDKRAMIEQMMKQKMPQEAPKRAAAELKKTGERGTRNG